MAMKRPTERGRRPGPQRALLLPSRAFAQPLYGIGAMFAAALFVALAAAAYDRIPSPAARAALALGAGALSLAGVLTVLLCPTRVALLRKGVSMSWLGPETFIPYDEVEGAEPYGLDMIFGYGVLLSLHSGEVLRLTTRLNIPFGDGGKSARLASAILHRKRRLAASKAEPPRHPLDRGLQADDVWGVLENHWHG
jgi:hypothetical protein